MISTTPTVDVPAEPYKLSQGYGLTRVYTALVPQDRAPGKIVKVRVDIRRDFYPFQCRYGTAMLTPEGWKPLHFIAYDELESEMPSATAWERDHTAIVTAVEKVAERLVKESYKILGPY